MSEHATERMIPLNGPEHAVPWPTPFLPGTTMLTFWGTGDRVTEPFVLTGDASVRIAAEKGPFVMRVLHPDGTDATALAPLPNGGLGLGAIPRAGTYALEVRAPGTWGVTVVFETRP